MSSTFLRRVLDYFIFSMAILLAFLLFFESYLKLPFAISWFGHLHPLVLHFPIVLVLVTIIQYWRNDPNISWYLAMTTLLTLISAISGFVLSLDGATKGDLILTHQWLGVSVSYLMSGWYWISKQSTISALYYKITHTALVGLIVLTGHFGGMITHGKDFLSFSGKDENEEVALPDDPNIYLHIVQPILDKNCVSCHNQNKSKGELLLTDYTALLQGGKSGQVIDKTDLDKSELIKRIHLLVEEEDHMPPAEEDQLSESDLIVLTEWIKSGADSERMYSEIDVTNPLHSIIQDKIMSRQLNNWRDLPAVSDEEISELSSEYCNILRIHNSADALQVLVFQHLEYSPDLVQKLKPLAKNIIELDLSNLPLSDLEMKAVSGFSNLEILKMNNTPVDDVIFSNLAVLDNLKILRVYNTKFGKEAMAHSLSFPSLAALYVYNTEVKDENIETFFENRPEVNVVKLSEEALEFKSVLPAPKVDPLKYFFRKPFYVKLDHPLPGIDLNYTTDGSDPNLNSPNIPDSILVDNSFTMKFFASKEGWETSSIDSIKFLKSVYQPVTFDLEHSPNQKYEGRGKSLLFDLQKGPGNRSDSAWMAFREEAFVLTCEFEQEVILDKIVLSSSVRTDPYIFPPSSIRVVGGMTSGKMKLIGSVIPDQPKSRLDVGDKNFECKIKSSPVKFIKITVQPLQKIPGWHQGKGEQGWFFIDEVLFQ